MIGLMGLLPLEVSKALNEGAAEDAKRMGLDDMGFGRYGKDGVQTHMAQLGKLVPFVPKDGPAAAATTTKIDKKKKTGVKVDPATGTLAPKAPAPAAAPKAPAPAAAPKAPAPAAQNGKGPMPSMADMVPTFPGSNKGPQPPRARGDQTNYPDEAIKHGLTLNIAGFKNTERKSHNALEHFADTAPSGTKAMNILAYDPYNEDAAEEIKAMMAVVKPWADRNWGWGMEEDDSVGPSGGMRITFTKR